MLKNVKKSRLMAKKKNLTTFDQNDYDIRDQRPIKHIIPLENSTDLKGTTKRSLASGVRTKVVFSPTLQFSYSWKS